MIQNEFRAEQLTVKVSDNREDLGEIAAKEVCAKIKGLLHEKKEVNIIFAAAPSQNEFLENLIKAKQIDWSRVNAFHMDEYQGLDLDHPMRFGNFLKDHLFDKVSLKKVFFLNGNGRSTADEIKRYTVLLEQHPVDIVCMGIGENTHIAFNDPHVADFTDPQLVKEVELDKISRRQQVNDKCFSDISQVPVSALTLTIPALLRANHIACIVPGKTKADAVYHTLREIISEKYPSTSLRKHPDATLYLDKDSAKNIQQESLHLKNHNG